MINWSQPQSITLPFVFTVVETILHLFLSKNNNDKKKVGINNISKFFHFKSFISKRIWANIQKLVEWKLFVEKIIIMMRNVKNKASGWKFYIIFRHVGRDEKLFFIVFHRLAVKVPWKEHMVNNKFTLWRKNEHCAITWE